MHTYSARTSIASKSQKCLVIALLSMCATMAPSISATEYVEIATELNFTWQSQPKTVQRNNTARCIVGTNDWFMAGDFLQNAHLEYWLIGTDVAERKVITSSMYLKQAEDIVTEKILGQSPRSPTFGSYPREGETFIRIRPWLEPFGYGEERAVWLAFCSGSYLQRDGRQIPVPLGPTSRALGYSDKTVVFQDIFGLPKTVKLYATSGELVCEYEVLQATNFLGRTFPLKFRLVQYGQADNGNAKFIDSKSELLGEVTSIQIGKLPRLPDEVRQKLQK